MTPVTKNIIDSIMDPDAKMASGTWVMYLVSMNSSITTHPVAREIMANTSEVREKKIKGL